jgi:hypothetical protein
MSYEKAMKHASNIRKRRKQASMHFGFDSSTIKETPLSRSCTVKLLNIKAWFKDRHTHSNKAYIRECISQEIAAYRSLFNKGEVVSSGQ